MPTPADVNLITAAVGLVGRSMIARTCGCTRQAIIKWERAARLPRTELTGETDYALRIARLTNRRISRTALLNWTVKGWRNGRKTGA